MFQEAVQSYDDALSWTGSRIVTMAPPPGGLAMLIDPW
jgi:hypothetical protein